MATSYQLHFRTSASLHREAKVLISVKGQQPGDGQGCPRPGQPWSGGLQTTHSPECVMLQPCCRARSIWPYLAFPHWRQMPQLALLMHLASLDGMDGMSSLGHGTSLQMDIYMDGWCCRNSVDTSTSIYLVAVHRGCNFELASPPSCVSSLP